MKYIFLAFLAFFISACATKALNYDPKDIKRDYNATWQYNFNIAELDNLIAEALKNNEDLETASLNLYQAMLRANIALSDLAPTPSASTKASSNRDIKAGGA